MLIARAPVRVSLAGGGTDLPSYYSQHGGMVVNATINKYFYVIVNVVAGRDIQITSADYRTFFRQNGKSIPLDEGELGHPRAILQEFGFSKGLSLFLASEVPPGTGLGSSSSVAVATIKAMTTLRQLNVSKHQVAEMACHIEIDKLGMTIGKQDQYASSFGGVNAFIFERDGTVVREALLVAPSALAALEQRLMLFFTRSAHNSGKILREQSQSSQSGDPAVTTSLHKIKAMAGEVRELLLAGKIDRFGELLDEAWQEKKRLARGISNTEIDRWYRLAREQGAVGGKITGAGGGGFLMLYCPIERQPAVNAALEAQGLRSMDFQFEFGGARVLMHSTRDLPSPVPN